MNEYLFQYVISTFSYAIFLCSYFMFRNNRNSLFMVIWNTVGTLSFISEMNAKMKTENW